MLHTPISPEQPKRIKRAKTLDDEQMQTLFNWIDENSPAPERDRLVFMLLFKAGLRAAEVAKIDLTAMTDAQERIGKFIHIFNNVGKKRRERDIPMHADVREALARFRKKYPHASGPAVSHKDGKTRLGAPTLTTYIWNIFSAAGFSGCSSHSGRRTFGTKLARNANKYHRSLKDVQKLLGHARLETTEAYIEPAEEDFDLVSIM